MLKACIAARAALAELRGSGQLISNQAVLIHSIPLLEAQASSEIENTGTTTGKLFGFANEAGNQADPATKETLRYRMALNEGVQPLKQRPVSTATAIAVFRRSGVVSSPSWFLQAAQEVRRHPHRAG